MVTVPGNPRRNHSDLQCWCRLNVVCVDMQGGIALSEFVGYVFLKLCKVKADTTQTQTQTWR